MILDWIKRQSISGGIYKKSEDIKSNVIKLRDDEPSGYYCLDGIFI